MQNIRNFFIAFGIGLVIFFIGGWLVLSNVNFDLGASSGPVNVDVSGDKNGDVSEGTDTDEEKEITGNSFTALFACTDTYTGQIDSITMIRVDKERKQYVVSSLPSYMVINSDGIEYYLGDLVKEKDKEFFIDKVYALTGMKIDYYAFVTLESFVSIIDEIGGVEFDVPEDMYYEDYAGEIIVDLKRGKQKLDGEKALQLVRYMGYENGDLGRRKTQKEFLHAALESFLKIENIGKSSDIYFAVKDSIDTNFTVDAFIDNLSLIFKYKSFSKVDVEYPGVYNKSGDVVEFIPQLEEAIYTYKPFRRF